MADDFEALSICYEALNTPRGIVVDIVNMTAALNRLYKAKATDPQLEVLQFRRSPYKPETELWVTKGLTKQRMLELKEEKANGKE